MKPKILQSSLLLLAFVGFSCSSQDDMNLEEDPQITIDEKTEEEDEEKPEEEEVVQQVQNWDRVSINLSAPEMAIAINQYEFPVNLLSAAIESSDPGNVLVSPLSTYTVLAMMSHAIDDSERGEILKVMNIKPEETASLDSYINKLMVSLPEMDKLSLFNIHNGFWLRNSATLSDSYSKILRQSYLSEMNRFEIYCPEVVDEINGWIKEKTDGAIDEMLDRNNINEMTNSIWVNTLLFKGQWLQRFNKDYTASEAFYPGFPDTSMAQNVDMMKGYNFRYVHYHFPTPSNDYDDAITTVMLPYGNESYIFTAVLPSVNNPDIKATLKELDSDFWKQIDLVCADKITEPGHLMIKLPKMHLKGCNDLIPTLKLLGLQNVFQMVQMNQNLGLKDQRITFFYQKVIFDLEEKGSEIKAATVASGAYTASPPEEIEFNRPFIYFVRERSTGAVLLAGVYNGPESNN